MDSSFLFILIILSQILPLIPTAENVTLLLFISLATKFGKFSRTFIFSCCHLLITFCEQMVNYHILINVVRLKVFL